MTPLPGPTRDTLAFRLPPELVASAPVEEGGGRRDDARLLVGWHSERRPPVHCTFRDLPRFLGAGDVVVVNTSATLPAAVPSGDGLLVHVSSRLPGRRWAVEIRLPCGQGSLPFPDARVGQDFDLPGGARARLLSPYPAGTTALPRLWEAVLDLPSSLPTYLATAGRPIRYGCPDRAWPLTAYQTIFADRPGSAEMPSAARGFTPELVTALVTKGVVVAPLLLHTGVSSQEEGEPPYPEWYRVPSATAALVNGARERGHRVVAVGTTSVRALESAADGAGAVHPASGWTELVVSPARPVRAVDGLITGWHEPAASHLRLLEAVAGRRLLELSYAAALAHRYRWHEFGDFHLILP